jgi:hypothetical protein
MKTAIVVVLICLLCEVFAHSERFHMRPFNGGRTERGKPQQSEKYLQSILSIFEDLFEIFSSKLLESPENVLLNDHDKFQDILRTMRYTTLIIEI